MNDVEIAHLDPLVYEQARREIDQCRLILHAHWVAFNHLGVLTVDYEEWDSIACRLDRLHDQWPGLVHHGYEAEWFYTWDTGDWIDLPTTAYILEVANEMVDRMEAAGMHFWENEQEAA